MTRIPLFAVLIALAGHAHACTPLRLGYVDQHRPPFFLGSGKAAPEAPGVSVELIREAAAQAGCTVELVRMPHARLRPELAAGRIDAAPIDARGNDPERFAYPLTATGQPDRAMGMSLLSVVYVRSIEQATPDTDPASLLHGRRLGILAGTPYSDDFRAMGIKVDDGALNAARNLEKLARQRIDGFSVVVATPADLDSYVAANYGSQLVRLERPIREASMWITFNRNYYLSNKAQVEGMWTWFGANVRKRIPLLLKKYEHTATGSP
jgi:ABC-type amino acid transport substrate-binding protein